MRLARLLQTQAGCLELMEFPIRPFFDEIRRDRFRLRRVLEKFKLAGVDDLVPVVFKWSIPEIRKKLRSGRIQAAGIVADINDQVARFPFVDLLERLLKEITKRKFPL